ncbi:hypothetical protein Agub_g3489, partial [Astrephomene gubernaculifera]
LGGRLGLRAGAGWGRRRQREPLFPPRQPLYSSPHPHTHLHGASAAAAAGGGLSSDGSGSDGSGQHHSHRLSVSQQGHLSPAATAGAPLSGDPDTPPGDANVDQGPAAADHHHHHGSGVRGGSGGGCVESALGSALGAGCSPGRQLGGGAVAAAYARSGRVAGAGGGAGGGGGGGHLLTRPLSSLAAAGLELGAYNFFAVALGTWGVQRISATKVAFLGQATSLITPLLLAASGQRVAPVVWAACGAGALGGVMVAADGAQQQQGEAVAAGGAVSQGQQG